jgi:hypothetical protein
LDVDVTSTGNLIASTSPEVKVRVLKGAAYPIASLTATQVVFSSLTGQVIPGGGLTGTSYLTATEGFRTAWNDSPSDGQFIKIVLDHAPAAGITLAFGANDSSGAWTKVAGATGGPATITSATTSANLFAYYQRTGTTDGTLIDTFQIPVTITTTAPSAVTPQDIYPTDLSIHATAYMAPLWYNTIAVMPSYTTDGAKDATTSLYAFSAAYNKTVLMIPYAANVGDYDTGITIANTTKDPGGTITGMTSPLTQSGKITFYFYPNVGAVKSVATTGAVPVSSLDATGKLPSGKTYVALLSELLAAAGYDSDFEFAGYVIAVCDFTNGHGEYFVSDFGNFTHGALMLVMTGTDRNSGGESFMH